MATQSENFCNALSQNLCLDVQNREPGKNLIETEHCQTSESQQRVHLTGTAVSHGNYTLRQI